MENEIVVLKKDDLKSLFLEVVREHLNHSNKDSNDEDEGYYNSKDVCRILNISNPTLHSWLKMNKLNPVRFGRRLLFRKSEIMKKAERKRGFNEN